LATNGFFPFADAAGANVIDQATWAAGNLSQGQTRDIGFLGELIAESQEANKAWLQATLIAAIIGQFIANQAGQDALDSDTVAGLFAKFITATQNTAGRLRLLPPPAPAYQLYVATGGNDANNGSSGAPFATIQRAWNQLYYSTDLNGNIAEIHVGPGTYAPFTGWGPVVGASTWNSVQIIGDTVTPTNVTIAGSTTSAVTASNAQFFIEGFTVEASGANSAGLLGLFPGTILTFNQMNFGACSSAQLQADNGAFVGNISPGGGSYTISGGAKNHMSAIFAGVVQNEATSVALSGTPAFAGGFATAEDLGLVRSFGMVFSGTATGPRYTAFGNGVIETQGSGAAYFPGDTAGTVSTGGVYN
jgi:hypothetical protein